MHLLLERSFDGNFVIWEYEKLCVLGLLMYPSSLEKIAQLRQGSSLEFAPVRKEEGREFLAGISFDPAADITIAQYLFESSLVMYSIDKERSRVFAEDLGKKCGFLSFPPDKRFIKTLEREIEMVEMRTYDMCSSISRAIHKKLENVFGAIRYMNFLKMYQGLSDSESRKKASQKFDIPEFSDERYE